ncbi:MAG: isochorismate synthase [Myxococcales bacterium]|nr:isochorismate synthase [Myxococcales bacterium]
MTIGVASVRRSQRSVVSLERWAVPQRTPLGLLAAAIDADLHPSFFWQDEQRAIIGLGQLDVVEASGPNRFASLDLALKQRKEAEGPMAHGPWFGGFSFESEVQGHFAPFGAARFILPRFVWTLERGASAAVLEIRGSCSHPEVESIIGWAHNPAPNPAQIGGGVKVVSGDFGAWRSSMTKARATFASGRLEKVVLSRDIVVRRASGFCPARVLAGLSAHSVAEASFALFAESGDCFLGLTPERLVRVEDGRLSTEALAGSSSVDDPDGHRLLDSAKDRQEHRYVAEYMREKVGQLVDHIHMAEEPVVRRLGTIAHLCSPIEAQGTSIPSILKVAEVLHPSPAVGGVPLETALEVIREAEFRPRGWYAGGIGFIWAEASGLHTGDLRVALRSALLRGSEARVFVGAGVVPASTDEGEWSETRLKSARTVAALGGA